VNARAFLGTATLLAVAVTARAPGQQRPGAPLEVRIVVAADTVILPPSERLLLEARVTHAARVVVTVTPVGAPNAVVWRSDTVAAAPTAAFGWDLRTLEGEAVAAGRYALTLVASDSTGALAGASEVVMVNRLSPDTVPTPPPLTSAQLEPEIVVVGYSTPTAIFIGTAAVLVPSLLGRRELRGARTGDAGHWIVAGGVTVLGFVAFLTSRRLGFSAQNARRNAETRARRAELVAQVEAANTVARERAGYRIWREGGAP